MNPFIENLNWRYAVKKYDPSRKISGGDLEVLKEAIRFSPSSMGLQPYKVLVITDPEVREKLKAAAFNQTPVTDAAVLFVFANITGFGDTNVDAFIKNVADTRQLEIENLKGFADYLKSAVHSKDEDSRNVWTSKQTYIALGNLVSAAASLRIDATPMEGFNPSEFNEILGLTEHGLSASVIAVAGYRHEEDATQHNKKVRKPNEELFINL